MMGRQTGDQSQKSECGGFERGNIGASPAITAHCKLPSKLSDCPYNCKTCKKDRKKRIAVQIEHQTIPLFESHDGA